MHIVSSIGRAQRDVGVYIWTSEETLDLSLRRMQREGTQEVPVRTPLAWIGFGASLPSLGTL